MITEKPKLIETSLGEVEYAECGSGSPILCIHGAMGGYDQSLTLGKTIGPESFRYIGVSRPGYLGTPLELGKSPEEQAKVHSALLDALHIDSVSVMAISGGGPSALHFAHLFPERCKKLILCSTVAGPTPQNIPFSFKLLCLLAPFSSLMKKMRAKGESNMEKTLSRTIKDPEQRAKLVSNPALLDLYKVVLFGSFEGIHKRIKGTKNDIRNSESSSYPLKDIEMPSLIFHGTDDELIPFQISAKVFEKEIKNSQLVRAEKGGHSAIFTHNDLIREHVKLFLEPDK